MESLSLQLQRQTFTTSVFQIKIVNIRPEDIVEGNGKLTLGLIWTIILHFQVSIIKIREKEKALEKISKLSSHNDAAVIVERSVSSYYSSTNGASSSTTASKRVVEHEVFLTLLFYPLLTRAKFAIFIPPLHLGLSLPFQVGLEFLFPKFLKLMGNFPGNLFRKYLFFVLSY